ncbi:HK97-gp10 family putative phage morphogenesis protein [Lactobacillus amylovorus]|uniref:HK97-gp10 family putative phage morphogenesis protein n=1 Tax=Lactobacillus amylovorus TaxID=1604 RepID=UPI0023305E6F|nr:HK97-gp10 family putative phage morphogenesis protein [Lactobacillus amylovorus]MDB6233516.1 HK97 gp10 family phage protein [Lactobacillus amylovorus]MDB6259666.1 HK97 gp10 family phage protein [Lactobacillus amylovorus]
MAEVKIEGLNALVQKFNALKYTGSQIRSVVKKNGAELQQQTQKNMLEEYKGHYEGKKFVKPTGATRRSAAVEIKDNGMTAVVAPNTSYFPYLEYGTRFMEARPTLGPAFKRVSPIFIEDIKRIINES